MNGPSNPPAGDVYEARLRQIDLATKRDRSIDHRWGTARVVAFAIAAIAGLIALTGSGGWYWAPCVGAFVIFLGLVIANEPVRQRLQTHHDSGRMLRRLRARVTGDWASLQRIGDAADPTLGLSPHRRAVASDLDLFGPTSLFRLVSVCGTAFGVRVLADWMTQPIERNAAVDRAAIATAMVPLRDQRLQFYQTAESVGVAHGNPDALVQWVESPSWLRQRRWLLVWAKISVAIAITSVLGVAAAFLIPATSVLLGGPSAAALLLLPVVNLILSMTYLSPAHKIFSLVIGNRRSVADYRQLFNLAADLVSQVHGKPDGGVDVDADAERCDVPLADRLIAALSSADKSAIAGFDSLQRISAAGSLRSSAATFLLYLPLQLYGLYDVWVVDRLETWQSDHRDRVRSWFDAVGQVETLASVAAVRDEHPDWVTPDWVDADADDVAIRSEQLGHPLLPDDGRVCNDVSIGPRGTLLLVTGSNMSGKSTMLRSVGLNVCLAGIGAPVCATSMSLPPVELATSIRVGDDLSQGVSFYMAELKRLRSVVDRAAELSQVANRVCLFLLDEILQGTNSRERQIAVSRVLDRLVQYGAIGAITTHDLELADDEQLMSKSQTVHFRETIRKKDDGSDEMTFDYRMHQGVCPTTNAIRLLEIVGL